LNRWHESESPIYVPDLYFFREAKGQWCVRLASESYALRWSDAYKNWLCQSKSQRNTETGGYFLSQGQMAKQWMRALASREALLHRIGRFILDKQCMFFKKEDHPLMPLLQKSAAGELGINPATLSRALREKYASVPWRVMPLSDFFPRAREKDRVRVAIPQVRQKICEWIAEENKNCPLSDENLSRRLREEMHWNIPRRTVESYRRRWNIASSRDRKYGLSSC
jgi:RNA polymerase sigma-54 factor